MHHTYDTADESENVPVRYSTQNRQKKVRTFRTNRNLETGKQFFFVGGTGLYHPRVWENGDIRALCYLLYGSAKDVCMCSPEGVEAQVKYVQKLTD